MFRNKNQWLFEAKTGEGSFWICPYDGQRIQFTSGPVGCSNSDCPSYNLKDFRPSVKIAKKILKSGERLSDYGYEYADGKVRKNWQVFDENSYKGMIFITDTRPNMAIRSKS